MIDHEQRIGAALRAVSDDVRTRPTLVADVRAGAVRRRRRRRVAGVAGATVAVAVAVSAITAGGLRSPAGPDDLAGTPGASASTGAPAPTTCRIDRLPIPDGSPRSIVTGGDPTGRYLVGRAYGGTGNADEHPLLIWDNGRATTVDMPGTDETFKDVNSSGVAVGSSFNGSDIDDGTRAYVYRDGKLTELRAPAAFVDARAVGEDGTVVGTVADRVDGPQRPVVWRDPSGPAQELTLPNGFAAGAAVDVDADGTIVGLVSRNPLGDAQGYVWKPDGTGYLPPMPEINGTPAKDWLPTSVHNGVVVGEATILRHTPLLFDLRTGAFTLLTHHPYGTAGNTMGWLLVTANPPYVATPTGEAVLPPLSPTGDRTGDRAVVVSEDGRVVGGQSNDAGGRMQAVRWHCA